MLFTKGITINYLINISLIAIRLDVLEVITRFKNTQEHDIEPQF